MSHVVREAIEREVIVPGEFVEMHFIPWEVSSDRRALTTFRS